VFLIEKQIEKMK